MSTKKILVIEDNQKHLADAKAFFADKPEYEVEFAETPEALLGIDRKRSQRIFVLTQDHCGTPLRPFSLYKGVITPFYEETDYLNEPSEVCQWSLGVACVISGKKDEVCATKDWSALLHQLEHYKHPWD